MIVPSFFVESNAIIEEKMSNLFHVDTSSYESNIEFFIDVKRELQDIADNNSYAKSFLRFIRCQEKRHNICILNDTSQDSMLLFLISCQYYFGY